jgi:hypothetical protein
MFANYTSDKGLISSTYKKLEKAKAKNTDNSPMAIIKKTKDNKY